MEGPAWRTYLGGAAAAVVIGPAVSGALLMIAWALLHLLGVLPTRELDSGIFDTLPGGNAAWGLVDTGVFVSLILVDAVVRQRCFELVTHERVPLGIAVLSVLLAPGLWVWLGSSEERLPVLVWSLAVATVLMRWFADPTPVPWRPSRRQLLATCGLATAAAAAAWVAAGGMFMGGWQEQSQVRFVPTGLYDTDRTLSYRELSWGNAKPTVAIYRIQIVNAGLFPGEVTGARANVSGGLLKPLDADITRVLNRGDTLLVSLRLRVKSCWQAPSGEVSRVESVRLRYDVMGVGRTADVRPSDPLTIACPVREG